MCKIISLHFLFFRIAQLYVMIFLPAVPVSALNSNTIQGLKKYRRTFYCLNKYLLDNKIFCS